MAAHTFRSLTPLFRCRSLAFFSQSVLCTKLSQIDRHYILHQNVPLALNHRRSSCQIFPVTLIQTRLLENEKTRAKGTMR